MAPTRIAFGLAAALWVVWGLVHLFAGVMTMIQPAQEAFPMIADATDPALFQLDYPAAVGAILNQHGWNLAWIGLTTLGCAPFVFRGVGPAIFLAALTGGMADIGYFLFLDLGGHVHFVPGTVMTLFSGTAVVVSAAAWAAERRAPA